jgi:hypothetical protein
MNKEDKINVKILKNDRHKNPLKTSQIFTFFKN